MGVRARVSREEISVTIGFYYYTDRNNAIFRSLFLFRVNSRIVSVGEQRDAERGVRLLNPNDATHSTVEKGLPAETRSTQRTRASVRYRAALLAPLVIPLLSYLRLQFFSL